MDKERSDNQVSADCQQHFKAISDTLYIVNGKWRPMILGCLASGEKHYLALQRMVAGIGPKMLSKELRTLEMNGLITRRVLETKPVSVAYGLTDYATSLKPITDRMAAWGKQHRAKLKEEFTLKKP